MTACCVSTVSLAVNGLTLNHPRIAAEDVQLQNAAVDYVLNIGADFIELDDRTRVSFNRLSFNPYLKFKVRPTRQLTLKLDKTRIQGGRFFRFAAGRAVHQAGRHQNQRGTRLPV